MTRRVLLISNPGERGKADYCEGVNRDMENYASFFRSPVGGFWEANEIRTMHQPAASEISAYLSYIRSLPVDYLMVVIAGQGYSDGAGSMELLLKPGEKISSRLLENAAARQTLIIDACRKPYDTAIAKAGRPKLYRSLFVTPAKCRACYDEHISRCGTDLVIMCACSEHENARDDIHLGGSYSVSLIESAEDWVQNASTRTGAVYSVSEAHDDAVKKVLDITDGRQNPQIRKPRIGPYFPFCVFV